MGITVITAPQRQDFADARNLIERLEDEMPPGLRGKLRVARDLLTEVEDALVDGPLANPGAA